MKIVFIVVGAVVLVVGHLLILGMIADNWAARDEARTFCQKHATTYYEYAQCGGRW